MAKMPKTVCLFLEVEDAYRSAVQRRAITFFHEKGIEGHAGETPDGVPFIQFDRPDWSEDKIAELKEDFVKYMKGTTGESL